MNPNQKLSALLAVADAARAMMAAHLRELTTSLAEVRDAAANVSVESDTNPVGACNQIVGALLPLEKLTADVAAIVTAARVMNAVRS